MIGRNMGKLVAKGNTYIKAASATGAKVWIIDCTPEEFPGYLKEKYDRINRGGEG